MNRLRKLGGLALHSPEILSFESPEQFETWLESNHKTEVEIWVRIFKKGSNTPSVDWNDCVVSALIWGWIDGQRKTHDEVSFLQRLTPRRANSSWSKRNCEHADRLIAEGRMKPAGLLHIEAAQADGRWEKAYSGSSEMAMPDDFLEKLETSPAAKQFFDTLNRQNLYAIYYRLQTAKRPETREKRMAEILLQLELGKPFHPASR